MLRYEVDVKPVRRLVDQRTATIAAVVRMKCASEGESSAHAGRAPYIESVCGHGRACQPMARRVVQTGSRSRLRLARDACRGGSDGPSSQGTLTCEGEWEGEARVSAGERGEQVDKSGGREGDGRVRAMQILLSLTRQARLCSRPSLAYLTWLRLSEHAVQNIELPLPENHFCSHESNGSTNFCELLACFGLF